MPIHHSQKRTVARFKRIFGDESLASTAISNWEVCHEKSWLLALLALLVVPLLVAVACAPAKLGVALPKEAQKLSELVPAMGEHWANPQQLPLGPIYLVHKGKVIGLEFMWTETAMKDVVIPTPAGMEHLKVLADLPVGASINHVDISFMAEGHEGFKQAHWDIHLYFVTPAKKNAIKPGG